MEVQRPTKHKRECLVKIITPKEQIRKFFFEKHLDFLTSVPQQRLQEMILTSCLKGNSGKMVDYAKGGPVHRTTYSHFLSKGKWDDERLEETQKRESFQTVTELAQATKTPVFVSIDDTVLPKTKPSSKAKRPTQGAGWYYSHLEGKVIYGHQIHAAIVGTGETSLCYSMKRCCPERGTKIDMTLEIIRSFPADSDAYVLADSWYTSHAIFDACQEKNCHLIGAMKTNRILYPEGRRISAADLAFSLDPGCFHPVTVKGRTYMVYRYEGALDKIDHAVVGALGKKKALRVFLCSDIALSDETILEYVEHVIRFVKRFRILSECYRNRRKRFALRFSLIAGICNFDRLA